MQLLSGHVDPQAEAGWTCTYCGAHGHDRMNLPHTRRCTVNEVRRAQQRHQPVEVAGLIAIPGNGSVTLLTGSEGTWIDRDRLRDLVAYLQEWLDD